MPARLEGSFFLIAGASQSSRCYNSRLKFLREGWGMNRAARIGILSLSVAIFCYAGIGHVLGRSSDDKAYKSLTVYGEVLQKIQQDYVDEPHMRTVTAGSLHGLLESLDPQSSYLTPREYEEYKKKLANAATGETGLTLSKRYGYIIVLSVLPDSPGAKAGVRSGDILEAIGGFTTRDMSVGQALIFSMASRARASRSRSFAAAKPRPKKSTSSATKWRRRRSLLKKRTLTFSSCASRRWIRAAPRKSATVCWTRESRAFTRSSWMCGNAAAARFPRPLQSLASSFPRAR